VRPYRLKVFFGKGSITRTIQIKDTRKEKYEKKNADVKRNKRREREGLVKLTSVVLGDKRLCSRHSLNPLAVGGQLLL